jgi:Asp/Glu/hydantoin racemase
VVPPNDGHTGTCRVVLVHATPLSMGPVDNAFAELWPAAATVNLLDDSLAPDKARSSSPQAMYPRFRMLTDYAVSLGASAILFTCSAFGGEIEAARRAHSIPILKPNEAMLQDALAIGPRIGVIATFGPTVDSISRELTVLASSEGKRIDWVAELAEGAFEALAAGAAAEHDALVTAAATRLPSVDVVLLAQYSMARALPAVRNVANGVPVLTSPHAAVLQLRRRLAI